MSSQSAPWRTVWISGASSGLGEHVARLLAQQGCHVAISARSEDKLNAIAAGNNNISVWPLDVTDAAACKETAHAIEAAHGTIDLALFSAGAWFQSSVEELRVENYQKTFDVNVMGVVHCVDGVLPQMLARGGGHIAWVSSVAGYGGLPLSGSYSASKSALICLAETMKPELDAKGVTLSVVNPGFVKTDMTASNKFPMPFLMEVEDAAHKMVEGLKRKKFEVAFPWQLVTILKVLNLLPYWLYFAITKRMV
ncbi:MAG: SDR family NAD(P)-dependent oxidoreductase [Ahrensia sp.]|nr:SDR family NAD(P)-dependent oxidoreductase [Ahrensia sp.]